MARITIQQWSEPVQCSGRTILDAALVAGVPFPHSCRTGQCGNCKCRLLSGDVHQSLEGADALTPEEQAEGLILACRSVPRSDVEVAWVSDAGTAFPIRKIKAHVVGLERATHDITRLRLAPKGAPLAFEAGQYARLRFARRVPVRPYSMANHPDDPLLEFHIRHVPGGAASGYVAEALTVGDTVTVEGPFGSSHLRSSHTGPVIAVAGGTGLAPTLSIVRTVLRQDPGRQVALYVGVRDERDVYEEILLKRLAAEYPCFRYTVVLSSPSGPTARRTGLVHEVLASDRTDMTGHKLYVCGPPPMVMATAAVAQASGLSEKDIHTDPFNASPPPVESLPRRLTLALSRLLRRVA